MKKFLISASALVLSISLFGCSTKSPEEIISEGVKNNETEKIIELYEQDKMTDELESYFVDEINKQTDALYDYSFEEYNESPYCLQFSDVSEVYPVTTENMDNLGDVLSISKYASISDNVHNAILEMMNPILSYSVVQYADTLAEEGDYSVVYGVYQDVATNENLREDTFIKNEAEKRLDEVSEKLIINIGETKTVGNVEFTLEKLEFSHRVEPVEKPIFYSYYSPDGSDVYVYVKANIKNISKNDISCDEIYDVEVIYNNDYSYDGFQVVQDGSLGFTYSNITNIDPLTSRGVDTLISCPGEVETNTEAPVLVKITFETGEVFVANLR